MDVEAAVAIVERALDALPDEILVGEDDAGHLTVSLRRDLYHLDADALNDRLHAWIAREVHARLPSASALVSFRHARPATMNEPELEFEEPWRDLEPMFRLDMQPPPTPEDLEAFARLVPRFLRVVHAVGRPEGWRDVEAGNTE